MERRHFLHGVAAIGGGVMLAPDGLSRLEHALRQVHALPPQDTAVDDTFWAQIRQAFTIDVNQINLNSGSVSPAPKTVADAMHRYWDLVNMSPSLYVDELLYPEVELVRERLARALGCAAEELALTRNTSESLLTVQSGIPLTAGDEVVITTQDYPRMLTGWEQRVRRDGIVMQRVAFPTPPPSMDDLYDRIVARVTPKTRIIHVSHMTYTAGQIFPVQRLSRFARERGIWSIVDGGHTFAQFPFRVDDLECDVYASSLHKWLFAPVGNGCLVVRRDRIPEIWPLLAAPASMDGNIRKFEQIGTYPIALRTAVSAALDFHELLGAERKAERLHVLRERWMRAVAEVPGVRLFTAMDRSQSCALGTFAIHGIGAEPLTNWLLKRHAIHVRPRFVANEWEGVRVTPNVFTTFDEIDRLVRAVREAASRGI